MAASTTSAVVVVAGLALDRRGRKHGTTGNMTDTFKTFARSLTSPPDNAVEITPNDTENLPHTTRALYVGGSGDVVVVLQSGAEATFRGLQAGSLIPIRIDRVKRAGTTATGLLGLW